MQRFFVIYLTIFLFLIISSGNAYSQSKKETGLQTGNVIPDITLNDVDGNPLSISQLRGNIVFVDFWASWCRPCRRENPVIVETYNSFSNKKFRNADAFKIFSISLDKNRADWIKAIGDDKLTWKEHVSDLQGWRSGAAKKFNVRAIPMNYLIDANGVIIAKDLRGYQLKETLEKLVEQDY
jgi:thiol-disulfide isomerase/thioredoxin